MARLSQVHATAFVTGASTGLGRAFARMLLSEGVRVWGTSRDPARLAGLCAGPPGAFTPLALDLADGRGAVSAFAAASAAAGGAFDLVVNNAGYGLYGDFGEVEASAWRAQIEGMLGSVLEISHAAYRSMRGRGRGCLVHISSIAAEFPIPYMSGYNVAKAGLSALSESLAFESRGSAITVIDFRPGDYRTDFNRTIRMGPQNDTTRRVWARLDAMFSSSPPPERAAADLRRALLRNRSGIVRSGSFFQARVAPVLGRLVPSSLKRRGTAAYFGV
jgi:short-subunit dehydrogenase